MVLYCVVLYIILCYIALYYVISYYVICRMRVFLLQEPEDRCDLDVSKCSDPMVAELLCGSYRCFSNLGWLLWLDIAIENKVTHVHHVWSFFEWIQGCLRVAQVFAKTLGFSSCLIVKRITIEIALPQPARSMRVAVFTAAFHTLFRLVLFCEAHWSSPRQTCLREKRIVRGGWRPRYMRAEVVVSLYPSEVSFASLNSEIFTYSVLWISAFGGLWNAKLESKAAFVQMDDVVK